jgi:hypothetical protein
LPPRRTPEAGGEAVGVVAAEATGVIAAEAVGVAAAEAAGVVAVEADGGCCGGGLSKISKLKVKTKSKTL